MQYKVINLLSDMKLLRNGNLLIIKKEKEAVVSAQEYQFLSQVYGLAVKGERHCVVQITAPVKIGEKIENMCVAKKRKHKKS